MTPPVVVLPGEVVFAPAGDVVPPEVAEPLDVLSPVVVGTPTFSASPEVSEQPARVASPSTVNRCNEVFISPTPAGSTQRESYAPKVLVKEVAVRESDANRSSLLVNLRAQP